MVCYCSPPITTNSSSLVTSRVETTVNFLDTFCRCHSHKHTFQIDNFTFVSHSLSTSISDPNKMDQIDFVPSKEAISTQIKNFQSDSTLQWLFFAYQELDASNNNNNKSKGVSNKIEIARIGQEPLDKTQLEQLRDSSNNSSSQESITGYLTPFSFNYFIVRIDANRYIFINWIGTKTKTLMKTRAMTHRMEIKSLAEKLLSMNFVFDHNGVDEFDKLLRIVEESQKFEFENMKDKTTTSGATIHSSTSPRSSMNHSIHTNNNSSDNHNNNSSTSSQSGAAQKSSTLMSRYNPSSSSNEETLSHNRRHQRTSSKPPKLGLAAIMRQVLKIDENSIQPLLKSRSFAWLLLGYNSDGLCQIEGQGQEQNVFPPALFDALKEDDMQYIILKWVLTNTGYGGDVEKTYFLSFVGSAVNSVRRGKVNQHKQEVYDFINKHFQLGGEVTITNEDELTVDYIQNLMLGNRSAVPVAVTDWGTPKYVPPPSEAIHTEIPLMKSPRSDPLRSPRKESLKSPRKSSLKSKETSASPSTTSSTSESSGSSSAPLPRKGSEILSKIKLGYKEGKLRGIKTRTPEDEQSPTALTTTNASQTNHGDSIASPKTDSPNSARKRKSILRGGVHNFSMENMDKLTRNLLKKKDTKRVTALVYGQNSIRIEDEEKAIDRLYDLKDPLQLETMWVLFSYPNEKSLNILTVLDSGSKPLPNDDATMEKHLQDDAVKYFVHKYYVERNSRIEAKFRIVIWRGKGVRSYFKAICTNHAMKLSSSISAVIPNVDPEPLVFTDISSVKEAKIALESAGTSLEPQVAVKKLQEKFAQAAEREREKASANSPSNRNAARRVSMKKAGYDSGIGGGLKVLNEDALIESMKELQSDSNDISWVMISYKDSKTLQLEDKGTGTAESFKSKLTDDKVFYILYKQFLEELGGAPKAILIAWVGQDVKPMAKASTTPHRIALFKYCVRHVSLSSEYQPISIDELDNDSIFGKVSGGGSKGSTSGAGVISKSFGGKSQSLTLVNEASIMEAIQDLKDDHTPTNWIKLGYNGSNSLQFEEKGTGGLDEFQHHLSDDAVSYVLYKTYVEHSPKIALITWVGTGVTAGTAKARATTHQLELEAITKKVTPVAALYQALEREELKEELIHKKVAGSAIISAPTAVSKGNFGGRDSNLKFDDDHAVLEAFKELRGNSGIRWLLFEYVPGNQYTVSVTQKGKGGVRNFKQYLTNDIVCYVVMRLTFMEYSDIAKAIVVTWVGENAPSFQKALSGGHRINLYEFTRKQISVGGEYQPESSESLSDEDLLSKITGTKNDNAGDALEEKIQQQRTFERERIVQVQPTIEVKDAKQYIGEYKDIEFNGKEEIKQALANLAEKCRNEQHDKALENASVNYIKMKLTGKELRDVVIEESGDNGLTDEWRERHLSPNECLLFVFGLFTSEGGYGMMTKFVFVQWIGHDVKHLLKAKASEIRQSIYNFIHKELYMSGEIQGCTKPEHVTLKLVMEKITGSNVRGSEMKLEKKDKKFQGLGKEKKSKLSVKDQDKLMHLVEDMILQDYLEKKDEKKDEDEENEEWKNHKRISEGKLDWILMSYVKDSIDEIEVTAYGEGDVHNFKSYLKPNSVNFAIIRVFHAQGYAKDISMLTDNRINLAKPYFTLIYWKGENVQVLEKALTSHHFNSFHKLMTQKFMRMKSSLQGSTYQAEHEHELDMDRIKKLMRLYD